MNNLIKLILKKNPTRLIVHPYEKKIIASFNIKKTISLDNYNNIQDFNKKDLSGYLEMYLPHNQNNIKNCN